MRLTAQHIDTVNAVVGVTQNALGDGACVDGGGQKVTSCPLGCTAVLFHLQLPKSGVVWGLVGRGLFH